MKGDSPLFDLKVEKNHNIPPEHKRKRGKDFNTAGSKLVREVDHVATAATHSLPTESTANTVIRNFKDGELITERYFDKEGKPYLDIDYTNHGNSVKHPTVPHQHKIWEDENGFHRGKQEDI